MRWGHDEREALLNFCERDREEICCDFFLERTGFTKKKPAVWLEDFLDFHGVLVEDRCLPRGQLGLCDMENGWIFLSTELGEFADSPKAVKALRMSTLGHELGHLRLHSTEEVGNVLVSHYGDNRLCHPRAFQREMEADLYAGCFMMPRASLENEKSVMKLLQARETRSSMSNSSLWNVIYEMAGVYGVTPTLAKKRFIDLGWVKPTKTKAQKGSAGKAAILRLVYE